MFTIDFCEPVGVFHLLMDGVDDKNTHLLELSEFKLVLFVQTPYFNDPILVHFLILVLCCERRYKCVLSF